MSIIGVAMATAILIVGRYSFDAIDYLMRMQFDRAARRRHGHFFLPRPREAVRTGAFARRAAVEPFRTVAVRFRADIARDARRSREWSRSATGEG
jgi:putative ABC transport system permease protein